MADQRRSRSLSLIDRLLVPRSVVDPSLGLGVGYPGIQPRRELHPLRFDLKSRDVSVLNVLQFRASGPRAVVRSPDDPILTEIVKPLKCMYYSQPTP